MKAPQLNVEGTRRLVLHLRGAVQVWRNQYGPKEDLTPHLVRYLHNLARIPQPEAEAFVEALRGKR